MDTLGSLVDKLVTVDMKMWHNQERLYEIRRMTSDEFSTRYGSDTGLAELHAVVTRCCDLNVQRVRLIEEIDRFLAAAPGLSRDDLVKPQHKTY